MPTRPSNHDQRMERVRLSLDGLSLGDSFGEQFLYQSALSPSRRSRELPPPPWRYTDDTEMALAIAELLEEQGTIEQDLLALRFAERYALNPHRGYGAGAHELLGQIGRGEPWREAARNLFGGHGSLGNGAAMRVAPLGAYFADDGDEVVARQAHRSAEVTHANAEGIAGAIAVALAACWATRGSSAGTARRADELFAAVLKHTPPGATRRGIEAAAALPRDTWQFDAAQRLGNGSAVTASDTVPFCLWIVARHQDDFLEAMWSTVHVGGDVDTNCAIIGGIVSLAVGRGQLPRAWLAHREPLR